jgi:hypothetical protein
VGGTNVTGHDKGQALISRMVKSRHTIRIVETPFESNASAADDKAASTPGEGSGGEVQWNPTIEFKCNTMNPDGTASPQFKPPWIGLAHELIHGDHYQRGVFSDEDATHWYVGLGKKMHFATIEEQRTVGVGGHSKEGDITENDIRDERGLPLRASY